MQNPNDIPVTITGVGRSGPGLRLLPARNTAPQTLLPEQSQRFDLRYEVTNCRAVPKAEWPVPVFVKQESASKAVYAPLQMSGADAAGESQGQAGPPWQSVMAAGVCDESF
ncbi:hypothetical protein [Streptosporangium sp. NPDC000396]|uniref:hypothetical protein n=1 Tax=Streptosporangium sp. NPDC000396 TaxID=3366185 RepID=UPI0036CF9960